MHTCDLHNLSNICSECDLETFLHAEAVCRIQANLTVIGGMEVNASVEALPFFWRKILCYKRFLRF